MELLGERPVWSMSGGELLSELDVLDAEIAQLETRRLHVVGRIDETGYAQELGARDAVELLAVRHRRDRADVSREVRLARALPKYGAVSDGLVGGASAGEVRVLRVAQAAAIVAALERVRARVPVEDLDVAEEQLVSLADHLPPADLRKAAKEISDLLDADGPEPDEKQAYERESLTLMNAENGVKFIGYLANENAELLRSLTFEGARPHKTVDGELDPRPRDKRQADALTTALTIAAAATDAGFTSSARSGESVERESAAGDPVVEAAGGWVPGFGAKANITVTIDLEDLKRATADATDDLVSARVTGDLVYGDALSAAAIRRLACDAKVIPLVLGSNSAPLDVGRSVRLVTRAMRRALNARDKGCVVCGAPPVMCDAHHLQSWIDGGATAIHNLALLCRRHHRALHDGHWTITITNGKVHVSRPTWADPPPLNTAQATPATSPLPPSPPTPAPMSPATPPGCPPPNEAPPRPDADPGPPPGADVRPPPDGVDALPPPGADDAVASADAASRWRADTRALEEAARFAVWGASEDPEARTTPLVV
ncbi:HNH endonuclease signature motif containing protein [Kribbella sindirgiensis]|uniref:HNH endonuclease n=1 Tax=Kribbella sindirgiensis TaxID=1124744 RepID=A0A4R0IBL4_9ACTN|nr:HNH endonuclease signature motif containing protein [Kribbella sindirgiensis]TCC19912.1 HNH endonuclease [Kribbella sindirgiensis]